jgi:hypothetical protein
VLVGVSLFGIAAQAVGVAFAGSQSQIDVSRAPGPQNGANIVVDPRNPSVLLASSQNSDFSACGIRAYASTNAGRTWSSTLLPAPPGDRKAEHIASGPGKGTYCTEANQWGAIGPDGSEYVAYLASDKTARRPGRYGSFTTSVFVSYRDGVTAPWSAPRRADPTLNTSGRGGLGYDDKPVIVVDTTTASPYRGRVYLAWTRWTGPVDSPNSSTIESAYSDDHGRHWSKPTEVSATGGWGVQFAVASDGTLFASWWNNGPALQVTRSTDGGNSYLPAQTFASSEVYPFLLDGRGQVEAEPTEPVNPNPSMDIDRSHGRYHGRIYNAYSLPSNRGRLVHLTVLDQTDHGLFSRSFTRPQRAGSRDEFDPTVAVDQSSGTVWLCFYLTAAGANRARATYSCTHSSDGGATWVPVAPVASVPSDETQPGAFNNGLASEYAAYNGLAAADGTAHPIWTDTRRLQTLKEEIFTTTLRS